LAVEPVTSASGEQADKVIASKTATSHEVSCDFRPVRDLVLSHWEQQKYGQQRCGTKNEGCEFDDHIMGRPANKLPVHPALMFGFPRVDVQGNLDQLG
jgi:hypothetical protein